MNSKAVTSLVILVVVLASVMILLITIKQVQENLSEISYGKFNFFVDIKGTNSGKVIEILNGGEKFTITKFKINISNIRALKSNGKWVVLLQGTKSLDLIEIKNPENIINSKAIEVGNYVQVKFKIDSYYLEIDNTPHKLFLPSKTITIFNNFEVKKNQDTSLKLEFNTKDLIRKYGSFFFLEPNFKIVILS